MPAGAPDWEDWALKVCLKHTRAGAPVPARCRHVFGKNSPAESCRRQNVVANTATTAPAVIARKAKQSLVLAFRLPRRYAPRNDKFYNAQNLRQVIACFAGFRPGQEPWPTRSDKIVLPTIEPGRNNRGLRVVFWGQDAKIPCFGQKERNLKARLERSVTCNQFWAKYTLNRLYGKTVSLIKHLSIS